MGNLIPITEEGLIAAAADFAKIGLQKSAAADADNPKIWRK